MTTPEAQAQLAHVSAQTMRQLSLRCSARLLFETKHALDALCQEFEAAPTEQVSSHEALQVQQELVRELSRSLIAGQGQAWPRQGWNHHPVISALLWTVLRDTSVQCGPARTAELVDTTGDQTRQITDLHPLSPRDKGEAELLIRLCMARINNDMPGWRSGNQALCATPVARQTAERWPGVCLRVAAELLEDNRVYLGALELLRPAAGRRAQLSAEDQTLASAVATQIQQRLERAAKIMPSSGMVNSEAGQLWQVARLQNLAAELSGHPLRGSEINRVHAALQLTWPEDQHLSPETSWQLATLEEHGYLSGVRELLQAARPEVEDEWWHQMLQLGRGWPPALTEHLLDQCRGETQLMQRWNEQMRRRSVEAGHEAETLKRLREVRASLPESLRGTFGATKHNPQVGRTEQQEPVDPGPNCLNAGQTSAEQASAGQTGAGQTGAGQNSAGQNSAGQNSAGQNSAGQNSAGQPGEAGSTGNLVSRLTSRALRSAASSVKARWTAQRRSDHQVMALTLAPLLLIPVIAAEYKKQETRWSP